MIETKYLIMIGIAICLLILYYFYDDISNIKKSFVPIYQKTMELEAKVIKLETDKIFVKPMPKKKYIKNESPAFSISYQSDMISKGNLSTRYTDISETEANNLLKIVDSNANTRINQSTDKKNPVSKHCLQTTPQEIRGKPYVTNQNVNKQLSLTHNKTIPDIGIGKMNENLNLNDFDQPYCIQNRQSHTTKQSNQLSDFDIPFVKSKNNNVSEESDTFNIRMSDLVKNNINIQQTQKSPTQIAKEYQEILDSLPANTTDELQNVNLQTEDPFDDEDLDQDVIRSITESIRYADIPSETILSDINISYTKLNKFDSSSRIKKNTR